VQDELSEESATYCAAENLQFLFESIEIPHRQTNPGKSSAAPEKSITGIRRLAQIPGAMKALGTDKAKGGIRDKRLNFIADVFAVFNMEDPVPRNA